MLSGCRKLACVAGRSSCETRGSDHVRASASCFVVITFERSALLAPEIRPVGKCSICWYAPGEGSSSVFGRTMVRSSSQSPKMGCVGFNDHGPRRPRLLAARALPDQSRTSREQPSVSDRGSSSGRGVDRYGRMSHVDQQRMQGSCARPFPLLAAVAAWLLDEMATARRGNLDPRQVARYDDKEDAGAAADVSRSSDWDSTALRRSSTWAPVRASSLLRSHPCGRVCGRRWRRRRWRRRSRRVGAGGRRGPPPGTSTPRSRDC